MSPWQSCPGDPTAANSAGHSAASVLRATLTTISGDWGNREIRLAAATSRGPALPPPLLLAGAAVCGCSALNSRAVNSSHSSERLKWGPPECHLRQLAGRGERGEWHRRGNQQTAISI
jgi:hypothetical protein